MSKTLADFEISNKKNTKYLNCPVRGELKTLEKAKDSLTFTEEFQRIECIKFLLSKKYPKENFDFERNILKYGNGGRNSLRADIIVYNKPKIKLNKKDLINEVLLVCEIKRSSEDKISAINNQLSPAMNHTPSSKFGIYWDNEIQLLLKKGDSFEYDILKLPFFGSNWEDILISYENLKEIKNSKNILKDLEQIMHNLGGTNKGFRYKEFFKIFLTKYYDESKNKYSKFMEFQILKKESKKEVFNKINKLYKDANMYYSNNTPIELEDDLKVNEDSLIGIIKYLQKFSFNKTDLFLLQDFFMYFAPEFLKKELDQYYTPQAIVDFMTSIIKIDNTTTIIDSSGGSADFLTGTIKKGLKNNLENIKTNIHYWDISPDAGNVASLNMILNGDGRTNIEVLDSIENYKKLNAHFDFCITNPPFGQKTKWTKNIELMKEYDFGHKWTDDIKTEELIRQELGILFIERNLKLLKPGGILEIVLPNGYSTNVSTSYIRKYLLDNYRIVGTISLPLNIFKKSGANGFCTILIIKNEKITSNYKIFTGITDKLGFDHQSKRAKDIYLRDKKTGDLILDDDNNPIKDNDLILVAEQFKKFIKDNNISGFETSNEEIEYSYTTREKLQSDENLILCAKRHDMTYLNNISKIKKNSYTTLKKLNAIVTNKVSLNKNLEEEYIYLDTGELFSGNYKRTNKLMGWELPGRAKQKLKKYDILFSKIDGSFNKFCMILEDNDSLVGTNGVWKISILDETERLNFYYFLHSNNYLEQMHHLSTGSILADVKEDDLLTNLIIPNDNKINNAKKMKKLIEVQEELINNG